VQANQVFDERYDLFHLEYLVATDERENYSMERGWCDACCGTSNVHLILMVFEASEIARERRLCDRAAMFRVIHNV
jgi:hypothetical protein